MEAGDAVERLLARAPAGDPEAERAELQCGVCAEDAKAEHADLDLGGLRLIVIVRPQAFALLTLVAAQLAQVRERVHDHPLAHPRGEVGIDDAHNQAGPAGLDRRIDDRRRRPARRSPRGWAGLRARPADGAGERVTDRRAVERLAERRDLVRGQKGLEPLAPGARSHPKPRERCHRQGVPPPPPRFAWSPSPRFAGEEKAAGRFLPHEMGDGDRP